MTSRLLRLRKRTRDIRQETLIPYSDRLWSSYMAVAECLWLQVARFLPSPMQEVGEGRAHDTAIAEEKESTEGQHGLRSQGELAPSATLYHGGNIDRMFQSLESRKRKNP
jgi:hypothetical protein